MSEAFLSRRGGSGGLSANKAVIHVTAPARSTITFSKGGVIVKTLGPEKSHVNADDNTFADWYYAASSSNYGTWTVTATFTGTLGAETASDTVIVDDNKEYDIGLSYKYWLYKDGDEFLDRTGGWTVATKLASAANAQKEATFIQLNGIMGTNQSSRYATCYTTNAIDLTRFDTIKVLFETWNPVSSDPFGEFKFGDAALSSSFTSYNLSNIQGSSITGVTAETTLSFDIMPLTGNYFVGGMIHNCGVKIHEVWLE